MINLIAMDVYNDTPTIVTIWLTIMPKISIIILLIELVELGVINNLIINNLNDFINILNIINIKINNPIINIINIIEINTLIKNLLLITSLLSLIIGTVVGLAQNKIKRLLAWGI
jgi:NADH-ubiquinone oxidoreductase chain 2